MFEGFVPRLKIGCLMPGAVIDNHAFEFYRLAPPGVMLVMVGVGLREFSRGDVERVFEPLDRYLHQLMERGVNLVIQNGVPLPILIGIEAHDAFRPHRPCSRSCKPRPTSASAGSRWSTSGRRR
jgi:hypothetical protein